MVRKILRSLCKAWHLKVIAIQEAKDLNVLSLDAFIGSLKTHAIELNEASDENSRKGKSIALKSTQRRSSFSKAMKASKEIDEEEESPDDEDEEDKDEIAHLAKKISKAWIIRMKKKKDFVPKKEKKGKAKQNEITYYECKEPRHLQSKCPKLKKNSKKKAMMAAWEDLDEEQEGIESQEEEEIVTNFYFVADIVSDEEIRVTDFEPERSYDDLQKAYDELLNDSQTLILIMLL